MVARGTTIIVFGEAVISDESYASCLHRLAPRKVIVFVDLLLQRMRRMSGSCSFVIQAQH